MNVKLAMHAVIVSDSTMLSFNIILWNIFDVLEGVFFKIIICFCLFVAPLILFLW